MPEKKTIERARKAKRGGKAPTTQAGEFVRETMEHLREGKVAAQRRADGRKGSGFLLRSTSPATEDAKTQARERRWPVPPTWSPSPGGQIRRASKRSLMMR